MPALGLKVRIKRCLYLPRFVNKRMIILRSGGLGDFILTIPILSQALALYEEVLLYARPCHSSLLKDALPSIRTMDLDADLSRIGEWLPGADVVTFWSDQEWREELEEGGARNLYFPSPRPKEGPHVTEAMFANLEWSWRKEFSHRPWLGDHWTEGRSCLWIHPGSGSPVKNNPFSLFEDCACRWLAAEPANEVVFSFGEADEEVRNHFRIAALCEDQRVREISFSNPSSFRNELAGRGAVFIGNDSGPGHLSASIGIPTKVLFRASDPAIWRPLGPRVKIYDSFSEVSKIL